MSALQTAPGSCASSPQDDSPELPASAPSVRTAFSWLLLAVWAIGSLGALWWLEWQESPLSSLCISTISLE